MSKMQTEDSEGNVSAGEAGDVQPAGILESPNRVVFDNTTNVATVYAHGVAVATLSGNTDRFERAVTTVFSEDPPFGGVVYDFTSLNWSHRSALLILQGEQISNVLGPSVCLLHGAHRPHYHQEPGIDGVRLVTVDHNPTGLSTAEVFRLAKQRGF